MEVFSKIRDALDYTVDRLSVQNHSFIVNIKGPADEYTNFACTVQVVDQNRVFEDGTFGLALYLAFDKTVGEQGALGRFKSIPESKLFTDVSYCPEIECFAIGFGTDVPAALNLISVILIKVYLCTVDDDFQSEVHDEEPSGSGS